MLTGTMDLKGKHILLVGYRGKISHIKTAIDQGVLFDLLINKDEVKDEHNEIFDSVLTVKDIYDWNDIEPVLQKDKYDGVFTRYEDSTVIVSAIAHHLGLRGVPFKDVLKSRNKYLMRKAFADHSVPSADYVLASSFTDTAEFTEKHGFPLIVKQIYGIHSKYVAKVDSGEELKTTIEFFLESLAKESGHMYGQLQNFYEDADAPDPIKNVLVEECLSGEELTVDAFVVDGKIFFTPICKYTMPDELGFSDHHLPIRTMPYDVTEDEQSFIFDAVRKSLVSLGANHCASHVEIFFDRETKNCRLIEVAVRGGGFRAEMVRHTCDGDYDLGLVRASMGMDPQVKNIPNKYVSVAEVFAPENGKLSSIDTSFIENNPDVHRITWNRIVGDKVGRASDGKNFILKFLVEGKTYEEAEGKTRELLIKIRDSIQVN
ncbi:ATP-grasp domain-containing protein [Candidatus Peregrinibacteria bacterium]|jgi:S-sulfo-L-cysteine synthase (3-phospho-L-serine-dependent)|nr:ATP-grasp domain-containing protein [Candidatus Peregrinibacteria bacterium]MBT3598224.1 ATP-grasp domain-containing protein [Candidatus Peregrinibacteria bacterium]MBT4367150.1 ATP-grasp domain-containing protein [Candidatus Peregrinibacteria bacterium]MBT4585808.1 ATP-grasp domain-containing protein [Candidatus Peregrinibacteria bacterium]MBT6730932.1 ATP-grasp domain-containing protein [Candidatus Peregrinibacteria bacterium]